MSDWKVDTATPQTWAYIYNQLDRARRDRVHACWINNDNRTLCGIHFHGSAWEYGERIEANEFINQPWYCKTCQRVIKKYA
jgi:hypothetical protein